MLHRREVFLGLIGAGLAGLGACASRSADGPIRAILKRYVGGGESIAGAIAVVVDESGGRMEVFGTSGVAGVALDEDTVFEIGSITKVLTSLLLVEMATRGEVALDDPVARYLPAGTTLRERGRPITLLDLATYTSSLPNQPANLPPDWRTSATPYPPYTPADLYTFLAAYEPKVEPGAAYLYSNVGFGLLGHALAHRAGKSFDDLLIERISIPLGLRHTRITLTDGMQKHAAQGRSFPDLSPVPMRSMPGQQGDGAAHSTARDMAVLLKACMGFKQTRLRPAFETLLRTRRRTNLAGTDVGLGWFISYGQEEEIVWKTGATGGFNSFIGYSPRSRRGAVVLQNGPWRPMNMGMNLINPDFYPSGDTNLLYRS